mgnify:CR=1 FL=1
MPVETVSDAVVFRTTSNIVASTIETLRKELLAAIEGSSGRFVIDLQTVGIIDSDGLALLMMCHKSLQARGGKLTVVTTSKDFRQMFQVMRLDQHFEIVDHL